MMDSKSNQTKSSSSGSSSNTYQGNSSSSSKNVPCPECNKKIRFRIWKGAGGWGDFYDTKPGYVKCDMCDLGIKFTGGFTFESGGKDPKQEVCPFAGKNNTTCMNGWEKCNKCNGEGTIRKN